MKWQHEANYHNSRDYDGDAPSGAVVSQARLTVAWLMQETRRTFGSLLKPRATLRSETILLKPGAEHGFTVLGTAVAHHAVHESAIGCPFPEQGNSEALRRQRGVARSLHERRRDPAANDPSLHSNDR